MSQAKCIRLPTDGAVAGLEPTDYIPPETLQSGDPRERGLSFMMPRGCRCTWDIKEPVRKLYVVLTAEAYQG